MQAKRKTVESQSTGRRTFLIALVAFTCGAGATWLLMANRGGSASNTDSSHSQAASAVPASDSPPDFSHLPRPDAATQSANWHYDRQDWPKAIEQYQQAIALGRDNADVRTDLGNCYRFSGQPQKALEQYGIAQRQNPQHEQSLFNTAGLYSEVLRDTAKATATWRDYLRRFPNAAGAVHARQFIAEAEQRGGAQTDLLKKLISEDVPKP